MPVGLAGSRAAVSRSKQVSRSKKRHTLARKVLQNHRESKELIINYEPGQKSKSLSTELPSKEGRLNDNEVEVTVEGVGVETDLRMKLADSKANAGAEDNSGFQKFVRGSYQDFEWKKSRYIDPYRRKALAIIKQDKFQVFVISLIVLNSISIGLSTFSFVTDSDSISDTFENIDLTFLIIFTVELAVNFVAYGLDLFKDGWLVFDFFLILFSWAFSGVTIIRSFRIFRALRLFAKVGPMKKMVSALLNTTSQLGAIVAVFLLVYFIFGVMLTQLYKDNYESEFIDTFGDDVDYFGRFDLTLFTLFFVMTTDNWNEVVRYGDGFFQILWYITIFFMVISNFVLLNLVIAVLCTALVHLRENLSKKVVDHGKVALIEEEADELSRWFEGNVRFLRKSLEDLIDLNANSAKIIREMVPELVFPAVFELEKRRGRTLISQEIFVPSLEEESPDIDVADIDFLNNEKIEGVAQHEIENVPKRKSVSSLSDITSESDDKRVERITALSSTFQSEAIEQERQLNEIRDILKKVNDDASYDSGEYLSGEDDFKMIEAMFEKNARKRIDAQLRACEKGTPMHKLVTFRQFLCNIVFSNWFQTVIIGFIFLNSVMMAIGTYDFVYESEKRSDAFETVDLIFLIIFTVELIMQIFVHDITLFRDGWLVFDFTTITFSWAFASLAIVRSFRIFRAFRLFGRVKAMKQVLSAILSTGPQLLAISSVLFILLYIFAVLFTQLFHDAYEKGAFSDGDDDLGANYFGRLDFTFATLLMYLTFEGWSENTLSVTEVYPWAWVPLVFFAFVGSFFALNLVVAMICDSMSALEGKDEIDFEKEDFHMVIVSRLRSQLFILNNALIDLFQVQLQVTAEILPNPLAASSFNSKYAAIRDDDSFRQKLNFNLSNMPNAYKEDKDGMDLDYNSLESDSEESYVKDDDVWITHSYISLVRFHAMEIAENERFQLFIIVLILINSVFLGIATFSFVRDDDDVRFIFERIDFAFLVIFTVELFIQFLAKGLGLFKDGWLNFDFIIVVLSWAFSGVTIIRSFRIFRALRLFGRIGPLKRTVTALASTGTQVGSILFLIIIISYIFAVIFTNLFRDIYDEGYYDQTGVNYFGRLDLTAFTLLILLTMDEWSDVVFLTQEKYWWAWMPLVTYMILTAIVVINMIIAVLCETVTRIRHEEEEEKSLLEETAKKLEASNETEKRNEEVIEFRESLESMINIQLSLSVKFPDNRRIQQEFEKLKFCLKELHSREIQENPSVDFEVDTGIDFSKRQAVCTISGDSDNAASNESAPDIGELAKETTGRKEGIHESFENFRKKCESFVLSNNFQVTMIILIIINSIMLGLSTFSWIEDNYYANATFDVIDLIILIIFTVELVINLLVFQRQFFHDAWLNFDLTIIFISWAFSGFSVVRSFRIFRAFRLFGRIEALRITTTAMLTTGPEMTAIFMVLMLCFYIFSVMFTLLFGDLYDEGYFGDVESGDAIDYFGRLDRTFFTCLMLSTLEKVEPITRDVTKAIWWGWIPIGVFVIIVSYVILSLVVGAFCESLFKIHSIEKQKKEKGIKSSRKSLLLQQNLTEEVPVDMEEELLATVTRMKVDFQLFTKAVDLLTNFQGCVYNDATFIDQIIENKKAEVTRILDSIDRNNFGEGVVSSTPDVTFFVGNENDLQQVNICPQNKEMKDQ